MFFNPDTKKEKAHTCDPHWYDALYKIKLKFVRHSFISYYSNFPSFNSSQVKVFQNYIKHSSDLLFFNANKKKSNQEYNFLLKFVFFFYTKHLCFMFTGEKETHARRTSQYFDSSDFVGYLKSRPAMTPYKMFFRSIKIIIKNRFYKFNFD